MGGVRPNGEPLWVQVRTGVGAFMYTLFQQGAFQGNTPQQAYFVKCDLTTMTQNDIDNGIVNIVVGFAQLKPAEFGSSKSNNWQDRWGVRETFLCPE